MVANIENKPFSYSAPNDFPNNFLSILLRFWVILKIVAS